MSSDTPKKSYVMVNVHQTNQLITMAKFIKYDQNSRPFLKIATILELRLPSHFSYRQYIRLTEKCSRDLLSFLVVTFDLAHGLFITVLFITNS